MYSFFTSSQSGIQKYLFLNFPPWQKTAERISLQFRPKFKFLFGNEMIVGLFKLIYSEYMRKFSKTEVHYSKVKKMHTFAYSGSKYSLIWLIFSDSQLLASVASTAWQLCHPIVVSLRGSWKKIQQSIIQLVSRTGHPFLVWHSLF